VPLREAGHPPVAGVAEPAAEGSLAAALPVAELRAILGPGCPRDDDLLADQPGRVGPKREREGLAASDLGRGGEGGPHPVLLRHRHGLPPGDRCDDGAILAGLEAAARLSAVRPGLQRTRRQAARIQVHKWPFSAEGCHEGRQNPEGNADQSRGHSVHSCSTPVSLPADHSSLLPEASRVLKRSVRPAHFSPSAFLANARTK